MHRRVPRELLTLLVLVVGMSAAAAADTSRQLERLRHNLAVIEARVETNEVDAKDPAVVFLRAVAAAGSAAPIPNRGATLAAIDSALSAPFLRASWAAGPLARARSPRDDADFADAVDTLAFLAATDVVDRAALAEAAVRIASDRQSDGVVRVVAANGEPVAGGKVRLRETRGEVRFGGNIYLFRKARTETQNRLYEERFGEIFDLATTDLYWVDYEVEKGEPNYARTAEVAAWCGARGIAVKGHPLLWWHHSGRPRWDKNPPREVEILRVRSLVERFRGVIGTWDVVNEPAHTGEPVDDGFRAARDTDPKAELLINDFQVFHDGFPAYRALIAGMIERGVPLDGIGIQGHYPLNSRFPLREVARHLASYAALGKPLHVSELTPPSAGQEMIGTELMGVWNEATQAEYAAKLYTICFAEPAVSSIVWWDLSDQKAWQPGGGLLRDDMSEKPAYIALRELLRGSFRTAFDGVTDAQGRLSFRGFRGSYEIEVDGAEPARLEVRRGGLNLGIVRWK